MQENQSWSESPYFVLHGFFLSVISTHNEGSRKCEAAGEVKPLTVTLTDVVLRHDDAGGHNNTAMNENEDEVDDMH